MVCAEAARPPNPVLKAASAVVTPLLKPIYSVEAPLQAAIFSGGRYSEEEAIAEIQATVNANPVVIYSYPLSPFCTEAVNILEETGCAVTTIEPGLEWFLLGPKGSALRAGLAALTGQTSFPHIFIGGRSIGGLYSGTPGLAALVEDGSLETQLRKARAL